MKKITCFIFAFFCGILMNSCSNGNKKTEETKEPTPLEREIEGVQEMLPIKLSMGEITKVTFENNYVYVIAEVDETMCDMEQLEASVPSMQPQMLNMIKLAKDANTSLNDEMTIMMKWVGEEKAGMIFIYKGIDSGREVSFKMTPEEIQNALESDGDSYEANSEVLDVLLDRVRIELGQESENGVAFTNLIENDTRIILEYTIDEDLYDIDLFKENTSGDEESVLQDYKQDKMTNALLRAIKAKGLEFTIRYIGDKSRKKCDINFSNDDL